MRMAGRVQRQLAKQRANNEAWISQVRHSSAYAAHSARVNALRLCETSRILFWAAASCSSPGLVSPRDIFALSGCRPRSTIRPRMNDMRGWILVADSPAILTC